MEVYSWENHGSKRYDPWIPLWLFCKGGMTWNDLKKSDSKISNA
jgi:hypothetical protein